MSIPEAQMAVGMQYFTEGQPAIAVLWWKRLLADIDFDTASEVILLTVGRASSALAYAYSRGGAEDCPVDEKAAAVWLLVASAVAPGEDGKQCSLWADEVQNEAGVGEPPPWSQSALQQHSSRQVDKRVAKLVKRMQAHSTTATAGKGKSQRAALIAAMAMRNEA